MRLGGAAGPPARGLHDRLGPTAGGASPIVTEGGRRRPRPRAEQACGERGEEAARRYLEGLGWRILARRFRVRGGEVDLIADAGPLLVFVEVKTRSAGSLDDGRGAVNAAKRRRLARAAGIFLARERMAARRCRFDVVLVSLRRGRIGLVHLPGAFDLPG